MDFDQYVMCPRKILQANHFFLLGFPGTWYFVSWTTRRGSNYTEEKQLIDTQKVVCVCVCVSFFCGRKHCWFPYFKKKIFLAMGWYKTRVFQDLYCKSDSQSSPGNGIRETTRIRWCRRAHDFNFFTSSPVLQDNAVIDTSPLRNSDSINSRNKCSSASKVDGGGPLVAVPTFSPGLWLLGPLLLLLLLLLL